MAPNPRFGLFFSVTHLKNRKFNLTFGVFGVIPSYLVRMEHIWCVFGKNKIFDEKYFFRSQNLRLKILRFSKFRNFENVKCVKFRKCQKKIIGIWDFVIEKIFFHQKFYFFQKHIKYAPSSPNMKVQLQKLQKLEQKFLFFSLKIHHFYRLSESDSL